MDILGIGPGEFVLILIMLLVVVGPERLPGLARQSGKFLVTARNWIQQSPDAAIVLRARQELEQELAVLRSSMAEVQSARDEVLEAAKQINKTVAEDVITPARQSIDEFKGQPGTIGRSRIANKTAPPPAGAQSETPAVDLPPAEASPMEATDAESAARAPEVSLEMPADLPGTDTPTIEPPAETRQEPSDRVEASPSSPSDVAQLSAQVQLLMSEVRLLQGQLRRRGLLDEEWQAAIAEENERAHVEH